MKTNQPKYSANVIEIADFIFANPDKGRNVVLARYGKCWQKGNRTIDRYYAQAKEHNKERIRIQENVKNAELTKKAKENINDAIICREQMLLELSCDFNRLKEIKAGKVFKFKDKDTGKETGYVEADICDEISAKRVRQSIAHQLSRMNGWESERSDMATKGNAINMQTEIIFRRYDGQDNKHSE